MFHKVTINRKLNCDIENDEEILMQIEGNVIIHPVKAEREFCSVKTSDFEFKVLGSMEELQIKFNL